MGKYPEEMTEKAKQYRVFIDHMLDEMWDDEEYLKDVFTIVHRHFVRRVSRERE